MSKILAVGDVHGKFGMLNKLINKEKPDLVLQCGDFGYWPKEHGKTYVGSTGRVTYFDQYCIKPGDSKIYFCAGNHEDHESLLLKEENNEIMKNVFYKKKGSTL